MRIHFILVQFCLYLCLIPFPLITALPNLSNGISLYLQTWIHSSKAPISYVLDPPNFDFWKEAEKLKNKLPAFADKLLLEEARRLGKEVEDSVEVTRRIIQDVIRSSQTLVVRVEAKHEQNEARALNDEKRLLGFREFNATEFAEDLYARVDLILEGLKDELKVPPLENQTERYRRRNETATMILDKVEDSIVEAYKPFGIQEFEARRRFEHGKPHILSLVLTVGFITDNHPVLIDALIFLVVCMILPAGFFLRPLLRLFGFTPLGPASGSIAAFLQRYFFGQAVRAGSWFAYLQRAGMILPSLQVRGVLAAFFAWLVALLKNMWL